MANKIKLKRGTTTGVSKLDGTQLPVLDDGEPAFNKDDKTLKIGDGVSTWDDLPGVNADTVDGKHANSGVVADTIPVRDSNGDLPGDLTGNAATASKLKTARIITLSGDVSGSASFDGSANITISSTVANNSHTHDNSTITNVDWSKILNKPDPTITLSGDVSGSGTLTDLGDVTINVTVANDSHTHDTRYYTKTELDSSLAGKSDVGHNHDDRYYTESEIDVKLAGLAVSGHTHYISDIIDIGDASVNYAASAGNADKLDGKHASDFSLAGHTHPISDITDIGNASVSYAASAGNADKVDGKHASDFALAGHTHTISQITDIENASVNFATFAGDADTLDGKHASAFPEKLTNDIEITVGNGGNFATINEALEYLVNTYYPSYLSNRIVPKATIRLLSGFVMAEHVAIDGLDLNWITIIGDDAETTISAISLGNDGGSGYAAFEVTNGTLPVIGQLFKMDTSDATYTHSGIEAISSRVYVLPGAGVIYATKHGLYLDVTSIGSVAGSVFHHATEVGIYADHTSLVYGFEANVDYCGTGFKVDRNSKGNAESVSANHCSDYGIYLTAGSTGYLSGATATYAGSAGIRVSRASLAYGYGMDCSNAGGYGFFVDLGGILYLNYVTGTTNLATDTFTSSGIIWK